MRRHHLGALPRLGRTAARPRRDDAVALRQRRPALHFETALAINARIQSPLWIAHTQHDYAQALLRRSEPGDREHALHLLGTALATTDKLGLNALADTARRLKRQADAAASA
jgi:hypothetical protein